MGFKNDQIKHGSNSSDGYQADGYEVEPFHDFWFMDDEFDLRAMIFFFKIWRSIARRSPL